MALSARSRIVAAALCSVCLAPAQAPAQQLPSAGDALRDLRPLNQPPPAPNAPSATLDVVPEARPAMSNVPGLRVEVKSFHISGLTAFSERQLLPLLEPRLGPNRSFADLQGAAETVADQLRAAGYFLVRAYLPAQEILDGRVEIAVLEGRIGRVPPPVRKGEIRVSEEAVDALLSPLRPGTLIREDNIERALFLLGDLRGLQVKSVLQPGDLNGTADLLIELSPPCAGEQSQWPVRRLTDCRLEATAEADNLGSRYTGELRTGGSLTWIGPLRRGDSLSLRVMVTSTGGLSFGRLAYLMPVGPYGSKVGAAYSKLSYRLGTDAFDDLDAYGSADVVSAFATHPFKRGRNLNLFGTLGYDQRKMSDLIASVGIINERKIDAAQINFVGDSRDRLFGGGINNFSVGLTAGRLNILTADALALDTASGSNTQGNYQRLSASYTRLQALGTTLLGYFSTTAQVASKNLDRSEKLSGGGPDAVRAYAPGEAAADETVIATAELRAPIPRPQGSSIPGDFVGALFVDASQGRINKIALPNDTALNRRRLAGVGLGLTWGRPDDFLLRATAAWRVSGPPAGDPADKRPRFYLQLSKSL